MNPRPRLFIGSSVEGLPVAYAIQSNLTHNADVVVWDQDVFNLSDTTIESLIIALDNSDFGIFVFSPDDVGVIKGTKKSLVRDNVLFELGLFIGKLGRSRTFIIAPDNTPKMRIATDLAGVNLGKYNASKLEDNPKASTAVFCNDVRSAIRKQGLLRNVEQANESDASSAEIDSSTNSITSKQSSWVEFFHDRKYRDTIQTIDGLINNGINESDKEFLKCISAICILRLDPVYEQKDMDKYLKQNEENPYAWQAVVFCYKSEISLVKATKVIDAGLIKFPDDLQLIIEKADILNKMSEKLDAINLLKPHIAKNAYIMEKYTSLSEEEGELDNALIEIRAAFLQNSSSEYIVNNYAHTAYNKGKYKISLYLYCYLESAFPEEPAYKVGLGNSCLAFEFYDLAHKFYLKAIEIYSERDDTNGLENLGNILNRVGLYEEGRKIFLKAIEKNNNSHYSYSKLSAIIKSQSSQLESFELVRKEGRIQAFAIDDTHEEDAKNI